MDREKLEQEIKEISKKIEEKAKEIKGSLEYKSVEKEESDLWKLREVKENELRKLKGKVFRRYVNNFGVFERLHNTKNIKSSVKEGIKRGLGVKYINLINEADILKIINKLVDEDLYKVNYEGLSTEISELYVKIGEMEKRRKILENGTQPLIKKRMEMVNELNKESKDKENRQKEERIKNGKIVREKLPKIIGKIRQEVEKGLLLDALKE